MKYQFRLSKTAKYYYHINAYNTRFSKLIVREMSDQLILQKSI